jgi:pimeloyl-ACP methyl ester carboxylesterase
MKKCTLISLFLVLIFLLGSCDTQLRDDYQDGDWFYLENEMAIMPVWVTGNKASNVFIIYLHGGPGSSAIAEMSMSSGLKKMRQEYAVVYWDQRGSGISQGNAKPDSFTVNQCVEDLQKLVWLIRYKYNNPYLFLMGHSWGGTLGTVYLLDTKNQQYFSGWIEIDGVNDWENHSKLSAEWVKNKAKEKIAAGENAGHWQKEIEWYDSIPFFDNDFDVSDRHRKNLNDLKGVYYNGSPDINYLSYALNTPLGISFLTNNYNIEKNFALPTSNLHPEMRNITIPVMILWGRQDGIVPVEMAQSAFDYIGTDRNDKYLYLFENSAHTPQIEEPELFCEKVKTFVDKYR